MKMIKLLLVGLMVLALSGCSTTYGTGKVLYKGAKKAYIELDLENEKLEKIDNVLVIYDGVRTEVKAEMGNQKALDADTSSTRED